MYMAKRTRARTKTKKTTRRGRARARFTAARKSPQAKLAGKSAKNLIIGSGLINVTSQIAGPQTARAGIYAQPINLILAGTAGSFMGAGQKDLVSAGIKIAGSRVISTQIMPRLQELSTRGGPGGAGRTTARRTLGGYV